MPRKRKELVGNDAYNAYFPTRLRELITERSVTQQTIASYLGRTRQAIGYYCDGSASPDLTTLVKIAAYFNVSTDYLLGLTDVKTTESDIKTACDTTGLSQHAVEILASFIRNSHINEEKYYPQILSEIIEHSDINVTLGYIFDALKLSYHYSFYFENPDSVEEEIDRAQNNGFVVLESEDAANFYIQLAENCFGSILADMNSSAKRKGSDEFYTSHNFEEE